MELIKSMNEKNNKKTVKRLKYFCYDLRHIAVDGDQVELFKLLKDQYFINSGLS